MQVFKLSSMNGKTADAVVRAIKKEIGHDIAVEVNADRSEITIDPSADPQVVIFLIEGQGVVVGDVKG